MAQKLTAKLERKIAKAGLPSGGAVPFDPLLEKSRKGKQIIKKEIVSHGPKKGNKGYVDTKGRIWIKDRAHAADPDHWDVQENGGIEYFRVDQQGNLLP